MERDVSEIVLVTITGADDDDADDGGGGGGGVEDSLSAVTAAADAASGAGFSVGEMIFWRCSSTLASSFFNSRCFSSILSVDAIVAKNKLVASCSMK